MDADARPSAYAKAKVIQDLLAVANRAGLSDSAQLLVAHLLAISRYHDDGWTCYVSNDTLANRLSKNEGTIRRILGQVHRQLADVVVRIPGDIRGRASTYLIRVRELSERASALSPERASALCPERASALPPERAGAQIRPLSERASAPPPNWDRKPAAAAAGGAAAAAAGSLTDAQERSRVQGLTARPYWLPEGKPWVEAPTALRLVRAAPWATDADVARLMKEVRESRLTVEKPAGLFISLWRRMAEAGKESSCRA
jgi:hypothetical protein